MKRGSTSKKQTGGTQAEQRAARLKQALKANLSRRKAQTRARSDKSDAAENEQDGGA